MRLDRVRGIYGNRKSEREKSVFVFGDGGSIRFGGVEERSQGRIRILVQAEGVLGSETEVIRQMRYGGIDFARISLAQVADHIPEMNVLQLPYLYEDADHMWRVLDGEIGERFLHYPEQYDLIGLSWYDAGARNIYCSTKPVRTLEDIKGLNIRVQESDTMSEMITALGAVPVKIPYDQVYAALERRQVDGAENNWSSYEAMQHYEVARYYTVDEHIRIPEMQICAKHTWSQLSNVGKSRRSMSAGFGKSTSGRRGRRRLKIKWRRLCFPRRRRKNFRTR